MPLYNLMYASIQNLDGINVIEKDWDNLIILDACRYDYFCRVNELSGVTKSVVSKGSRSPEFIKRNFSDRDLHDTIYITDNVFAEEIDDRVFHKVEKLYLMESDNIVKYPHEVVDSTKQIYKKYPNKRLIIHFMQPHLPFIGSVGEDMINRFKQLPAEEQSEFLHTDSKPRLKLRKQSDQQYNFKNPYFDHGKFIESGYLSYEKAREGYAENLKIALDHVETLVDRIDGKSVVTADHGELLGERVLGKKCYGHPDICRRELRVVPWHIIDSNNRRDIISDEPVNSRDMDETELDKHLHALGYKT